MTSQRSVVRAHYRPQPHQFESEELPLRELLETLLGPDGKRRLRLRHMTNEELFTLYDSDLVLRLHNAKDLSDHRRMLARFKEYLNGYPPSPELGKAFLAPYANRKPRTLARYSKMVGSFIKWYGEVWDYRVKIPRTLPPYTEQSDVDKVRHAFESKATHKGIITRDLLLIDLALTTGMRRAELADLEPKDIHSDFLVVRNGKGGRDRTIPLVSEVALRLHNFTRDMEPTEKVFKLKAPCIANKVRLFAKKAGIDGFHTHSMRHKFACDLLERGANIKQVQELLGHTNLSTTETYLSLAGGSLRDAIKLLGDGHKPQPQPVASGFRHSWESSIYRQTAEENTKKAKESLERAAILSPDDPRLRSY